MKQKKLLSWMAAAMILLTGVPVTQASAAAFTDTQGHWAEAEINRAVDLNLFSGVSETRFDPDGSLTRAMFVTVLAKYDNYTPEEYTSSRFQDVSTSSWYAAPVEWAAQNGIVSGTSSTKFSPEEPVTREQIAVMLVHYANYAGTVLPRIHSTTLFADSGQCGDFALDAVNTLYRSGVLNGVGNNAFAPKNSATRAECAAFMCNYIDTCSAAYTASQKVTLVNHRGYSIDAPENTLPAYELSAARGYTSVEADVQFTKDNVPVLLHDSTIDRTSNGSGNVVDFTYSQLQNFDFGSWKSDAYAGTKIPTFDQFLSVCAEKRMHPYIELKCPMTGDQIEVLTELVNKYSMQNDVTWISFYTANLSKVKSFHAAAKLSLVTSNVTASNLNDIDGLKNGENHVFISPYFRDFTVEQRATCLRRQIEFAVWTVDEFADAVAQANTSILSLTSNGGIETALYP